MHAKYEVVMFELKCLFVEVAGDFVAGVMNGKCRATHSPSPASIEAAAAQISTGRSAIARG